MELIFPVYWFDTTSSDLEDLTEDESRVGESGHGKKLCCHLCRHIVTDKNQRFAFQGGHMHTRTNPSGYIYDFGCFQNAPGCRLLGPPTDEHTWFPGYTWQIAVCGNCGEHLGWSFRGSNNFYGLIIDRLIPWDENQI